MKIYTINTVQDLPVTPETAWEFLSDPGNLQKITPPDMGFRITSYDGKSMYPGQIISYTLKGLPFVPMTWVTEITHVEPGKYFVDEQRFGPYTMWHHKHFIERIDDGVRMTDTVHYVLPGGYIGQFAHKLFIRKRLAAIFAYRETALIKLFGIISEK
jgi:ligand-binding SRPBCC domain-containing protein